MPRLIAWKQQGLFLQTTVVGLREGDTFVSHGFDDTSFNENPSTAQRDRRRTDPPGSRF